MNVQIKNIHMSKSKDLEIYPFPCNWICSWSCQTKLPNLQK